MDLHILKGLKLDDEELGNKSSQAESNQASSSVPTDRSTTEGHRDHGASGLFNKISDALSGDHHKESTLPQPPPVQQQTSHRENLFHKISDALGSEDHKPQAPPPPPPPEPEHKDILHKIGSVLHGGSEPVQPPPPPPEPKHENLFDKIGSALGHHEEPVPPPPPPPKHESVLNKLTGAFGHGQEPHPVAVAHAPETKKADDVGLLEKISGAIQGEKHQEAEKQHGLGDKINNALGGGAKGESKEDALDKAIDLYQEHVLHKGPQDNESALEQAKDKQIADAIRDGYKKATGHEFFIKEKE